MKLVLASYFEPENHGEGRKIGISPTKPDNVDDCDLVYAAFSPDADEYYDYHRDKKSDKEAGSRFVEAYKARLDSFFDGVRSTMSEKDKPVTEILPFKDGDTLLSWEHKGHLSYRGILAGYLRDIGYEVIEN